MAIVQIRFDTEGRSYFRRRRADGKTYREALRCFKRRLSDVVYRQVVADAAGQTGATFDFVTGPALTPPDVLDYVGDLSATLSALRPDLVSVYLHGSAVLGGFRPTSSDVDVLAVIAEPGPVATQHAMGEALVTTGQCPGAGLEMSVITAATAYLPGDCRFEVHVNTTRKPPAITTGTGRPGDPDLVLHCAVCRDHALAILGPQPRRVFGPIPRDRVLTAMTSELQWGLSNAPMATVVLNACRALRYAEHDVLCSKLGGGEWYLARHPDDSVVIYALDAQRNDQPLPITPEAARFVASISDQILNDKQEL
jgi:hypothetical protein